MELNHLKSILYNFQNPYIGYPQIWQFGSYTGMGWVMVDEITGRLQVLVLDGSVPHLKISVPEPVPVPAEDPIGP